MTNHVLILACTIFAGTLACPLPVLAGDLNCGDPPPVYDQNLKGDIDLKADVLSSFLGNVGFTGKLENSRKEIFSKYPSQRERSDAYFEYVMCAIIGQSDLPYTKKLDELVRVKKSFSTSVTASQQKAMDSQINQKTSGANSPAIADTGGDVNINTQGE